MDFNGMNLQWAIQDANGSDYLKRILKELEEEDLATRLDNGHSIEQIAICLSQRLYKQLLKAVAEDPDNLLTLDEVIRLLLLREVLAHRAYRMIVDEVIEINHRHSEGLRNQLFRLTEEPKFMIQTLAKMLSEATGKPEDDIHLDMKDRYRQYKAGRHP